LIPFVVSYRPAAGSDVTQSDPQALRHATDQAAVWR
jgi:hypothetical protein